MHVSDLLDPKLAVFKKLSQSPIPDRLLNVFMVGKIAHALVELVAHDDSSIHTADAGTRQSGDILYSPDAFAKDGSPVEIKTTRSFYLPKQLYLPDDQTYHMYLEQLLAYMALENSLVGRLMILYLNLRDEEGKTSPQVYVWTVSTTQPALDAYRRLLEQVSESIKTAVTNRTPQELPNCRSWKCRDCEFWDACKPEGRYEHGRDSKGQKLWE